MKFKYWLSILTLLLLANSALSDQLDRMNYGFGNTLDASDAKDFIRRSGASPKAAYMWITGLSGTFRTSEEMTADDFIDAATENTKNFFNESMISNIQYIKDFLDKHTKEEIIEDEDLSVTARSYLSLNRQLKEALKLVQINHPVIYGIQLAGTEAQFNQTTSDSLVKEHKKVQMAQKDLATRKSESVRPVQYKNHAMDEWH